MAQNQQRVLLVEDEAMVAMLVEDMLLDLGFGEVQIVARLEDAIRMANSIPCDLAILDVNLKGVPSYPVAEILRRRGVPIIFTTGYGAEGLDTASAGTPVLQKPFQQDQLEAVVSQVLSARDC